jgi:hypothetical protein
MVRKLRAVLVAALFVAMVATIGGAEALRVGSRGGGGENATAAAGGEDKGLLSRVWDGAKQIVGQPRAKTPRDVVSADLVVHQPAPPAKDWPAQSG